MGLHWLALFIIIRNGFQKRKNRGVGFWKEKTKHKVHEGAKTRKKWANRQIHPFFECMHIMLNQKPTQHGLNS